MVYVDVVMALNFTVDLLLLMGTNCICGYPMAFRRTALAAVLGGVYGGVCLMPGFRFLGKTVWRLVFLGLMATIAFGLDRSALRRGAVFVFLSMALGGIALGLGNGGTGALIGAAAGVTLLCMIGFSGKAGQRQYTTVELILGNKRKKLTALCDTGNTLRDPITGQQVLVVGAELAWDLLGLTQQQLASPVETISALAVPGLRLIPYRAVGQPGGMLLAVKMDKVIVGGQVGNSIVAFAPQNISGEGYQALAGGSI